jgi:acyl-CoA dehydrogenase
MIIEGERISINMPMSPRSFGAAGGEGDPYFSNPEICKLAEFFRAKGLAAIKDEDARQQWYQDWLDYQAELRLYASLLSPREYSSLGKTFDLLKLTQFLEVFAYFSPAHGYSLQVSFLGLFSILMGSKDELKREAVKALEGGGLFAFGVSEKEHGSDLLSSEFTVTQSTTAPDQLIANGSKYYIGNANCAAIVSVLARKLRHGDITTARANRAPLALVAIRPAQSRGYRTVKKIETLGIRAAYVGEFAVKDHEVRAGDVIAEGRRAWDAVFGTVTLGKFFLGFGSIGICEHAMEEAAGHLRRRVLYRKSVLEMPHIRIAMAQAYARLFAMKLFAYRALDYVQAGNASDRRYLLYCAVQKAKVSTEGVKVVAQLSECIGARGFESDMYFESALRDIQLIPGLEGSIHINLGMTAQFMEQYFRRRPLKESIEEAEPALPKSLSRGDIPANENVYLMQARSGRVTDVSFAHFLDAYRPLTGIENVRRFAGQAIAVAQLIRHRANNQDPAARDADAATEAGDLCTTLCLAQCVAIVAYAQLIAENAAIFAMPAPIVSAIFHLLILDMTTAAAALCALPERRISKPAHRARLFAIPQTTGADWNFVAAQLDAMEGGRSVD